MTVPVIDIAPLHDPGSDASETSRRIAEACESVGFFAVTNHGIATSQLDAMRSLVARVFDIDEGDKHRQAITRDNYRGFVPLGFFTPNRDDPNAPAPDQYEAFKLHWECPPNHPARQHCPIYGSNRWADHVPDMADTVLDYWDSCDRLSATLLDAFAVSLGIDGPGLRALFAAPVTNMTLLHYPPTEPNDGDYGIHPHKDTNVITILHPDPVGGLFVRSRAGEWLEATCPPEALLINTGDMMELWSGGRFVSTPHQVVNTTGKERYAFPYFLAPSHDVTIEPLVEPVAGFDRIEPIEVGPWSVEVWRTNWPDAIPADDNLHLGTV